MRYTQLRQEERYQIYILKKIGQKQKEIADMLGRYKSTISREIRRNRGLRGRRPKQAHSFAEARHSAKVRPRIDNPTWQRIEALIRQEWRPEQITRRIEMEQGVRISHEWIYPSVYADRRSGGDLYRSLRCQKVRRKRYGAYDRRGAIPNAL